MTRAQPTRARLALLAAALLAAPLTACSSPAVDCSMYLPSTPIGAPDGPTEPGPYPRAAVDYFEEIAFGSEYGSGGAQIHRWEEDVKIAVHGDPTRVDLRTLCGVIADLNSLIDTVEVSVVGSGQNVDLHFVPESQFSRIEPNYRSGNVGFFWAQWDAQGHLTYARVLVSTDDPIQARRDHLIREEVTQIMGLMRDSYTHPDSIFYQEWSEVDEYTAYDEMVIEMLYLPEVRPGMTAAEARAVIPVR